MDPTITPVEPDFVAVAVGLLGGLAVFLYGIAQMTDALKAVAGPGMRTVLAKLTTNRFSAAFTGAFVTAVIQSSSVTTVLVVGFISAGLMTLQASVGVIMGANIGSTATAQLIAFNITDYALPLITVGFLGLFLGRRDWIRQVGTMIMGMGMVFLGMGLMSEATHPLREYPPFIDAMSKIDKPLLAILASAAFTAVVQSSAATTGIVIMLAGQGFITLEAGIALALGSNIGTCATAALAALGKPRAAVRAAAVHVLFNVAGVLIWMPFIWLLADVVRAVSPSSPDLEGAARMAAETPRQIANAHTLFNVANTFAFIWFTGVIAKLVTRLLPDKPVLEPPHAEPRYLDEIYFKTPALAVDRIRLEIGHLGELTLATVDTVTFREDEKPPRLEEIAANIDDVARIHAAIVEYAQEVLRQTLTSGEAARVEGLLAAANHVHSIADSIAVNFREIAREWQERQLSASPETRTMFDELFKLVRDAAQEAIGSLEQTDEEAAGRVMTMKGDVSRRADELARRLSERLASSDPNRIEIYQLESAVIEVLKRMYYFAKRIAKIVSADLRDSDLPEAEDEEPAA